MPIRRTFRRLHTSVWALRRKRSSPFSNPEDLPSDTRLSWAFGWAVVFLALSVVLAWRLVPSSSGGTAAPKALPFALRASSLLSILSLLELGRRLVFRTMLLYSQRPGTRKETKTSVENFRNLSFVLATAGGASLLFKFDVVFDALIMLNVLIGLFYMDFVRTLYEQEMSEDAVSYLIVRTAYARALSNFVRAQMSLVAMALLWLVVGRWSY